MRRALLTVMGLLALTGAAAAGPLGGKVTWGEDLNQALRTARYERKPVVLLYSAEWCGYSKQFAAEALSDERVVQAFRGVVPVLVDCTTKGSQAELQERHKVTGYPTLVFLDSEGKVLGNLVGAHPAEDVLKAVSATKQIVAASQGQPKSRPSAGAKPAPEVDTGPGRRLTVHELGSLDEALARAKEEGKLLALVFTVPEPVRRGPDTDAVVEALRAPSMKATGPRFLYVWQPLCDDLGLDTKDAEAWRARKSPAVVVLDPWAEVKQGERLPALASVNQVKDLPGELGRALIEAARAGHPPQQEEDGARKAGQ